MLGYIWKLLIASGYCWGFNLMFFLFELLKIVLVGEKSALKH
jgi:hypothetical protein